MNVYYVSTKHLRTCFTEFSLQNFSRKADEVRTVVMEGSICELMISTKYTPVILT